MKNVTQKPSLPAKRPVGLYDLLLPSDAIARYLCAPGELEGRSRRATDPTGVQCCSARGATCFVLS